MKSGGKLAILFFTTLWLLGTSPLCEAESRGGDYGESDSLHLLAGASTALLIGAVAYPLVDLDSDHLSAMLVAGLGVCGSFVAGAIKELLDLGGWGEPEWSDFLLTVGGGFLAGSLIYALTCLRPSSDEGSLGIAAMYGAFALTLSLPVGESLYQRFILSSQPRS
jgi:hypothetical protein